MTNVFRPPILLSSFLRFQALVQNLLISTKTPADSELPVTLRGQILPTTRTSQGPWRRGGTPELRTGNLASAAQSLGKLFSFKPRPEGRVFSSPPELQTKAQTQLHILQFVPHQSLRTEPQGPPNETNATSLGRMLCNLRNMA